MLKSKEGPNNGDLFIKKTEKLVSRKIWPMPGVQDQEKWSVDVYLQQMMTEPYQKRSQNLPHADRLAIFQERIDKNDRQSFHCAIGLLLGVAQFFGILPLAGVCSESPRKLVFKKFSLRMAYAVTIMVMLFTMAVTSVCHMIQTLMAVAIDRITAASSAASFYIHSVVRAVFFIRLAPRWNSLQRDWRAMERFLDRNKHKSIRLRWKFFIPTVTVMTFALVEHVLFFMKLSPQGYWLSASNWTFGDVLQYICEKAYPFIFKISNYNLGTGIFIIFIATVGTFTLNFTDVFVMLVSTGLSERYKTLNQRLMDTIPISHRNIDWREFRESYATLSTMVKKVDSNISPIILFAFANSIFSICLQLRNGLSSQENNILETIYFFSSFVNLFGKTFTVMLLAAQINDQSRLALPELYNCPGAAYNFETQRLQQQLSTDEVYLTGMGFFSITRNFILAVAGTIVTYEVLLLSSTSQ